MTREARLGMGPPVIRGDSEVAFRILPVPNRVAV
jgi:hypothetical protein